MNSKGPDAPTTLPFPAVKNVLTGCLVCAMLVFSPWAFGTTQTWAMWVMNSGGYLLGGLYFTNLLLRRIGRSPLQTWNS